MIHKEGRLSIVLATFILGGLGITITFVGLPLVIELIFQVACALVWLFIVQFFRNPKVNTPDVSNAIIAPANGKVVVIEEIMFNEMPYRQISIFMSPLDVHLNRSPITGKVVKVDYFKGLHMPAWRPKASSDNERSLLHIQNEHILIGVKQIAGAMARRIVCYPTLGASLSAGQEFGFIKFGSRVDVLLPLNCTLAIQLDAVVKGGESILATYPIIS